MQIVSVEDDLHETSKPIFWEKNTQKKPQSIRSLLNLSREW